MPRPRRMRAPKVRTTATATRRRILRRRRPLAGASSPRRTSGGSPARWESISPPSPGPAPAGALPSRTSARPRAGVAPTTKRSPRRLPTSTTGTTASPNQPCRKRMEKPNPRCRKQPPRQNPPSRRPGVIPTKVAQPWTASGPLPLPRPVDSPRRKASTSTASPQRRPATGRLTSNPTRYGPTPRPSRPHRTPMQRQSARQRRQGRPRRQARPPTGAPPAPTAT